MSAHPGRPAALLALLLISLSVHFNLAAFLLEAAWAMIASWGLLRALRARRIRGDST